MDEKGDDVGKKKIGKRESKTRVFVMGLGRTGTLSLHKFLSSVGYVSAHWSTHRVRSIGGELKKGNKKQRTIAEEMYRAKAENRPLLFYLKRYTALEDMNHWDEDGLVYSAHVEDFERLYNENSNAKFILNTRSAANWLNSIEKRYTKTRKETYKERLLQCKPAGLGEYLKEAAEAGEENAEGEKKAIARWREDYHERLREFFSNEKSASFLEFDIEQDDISVVCDFLGLDERQRQKAWWGKCHEGWAAGGVVAGE